MKDRVLIIYPFINQEPLITHLVKNLRSNGVKVDAVNSFNFRLAIKPLQKTSVRHKIISFLFTLPIPKIKGFLSKIINREKELLKIAENYNVIDFHYLSGGYDNVVKDLARQKVIKLTYWGSDFYRASLKRKEEQRNLLSLAGRVQISTQAMKNDIVEYFNDFQDKIRVANFGLYQFEVISKIEKSPYSPSFKTDEYKDKLMLVCGYNGSEAQQHSILIEEISHIDQNIQSKIFLVFPMTYGADTSYLKMIKAKLKDLKIPCIVLNNHLSDIDIAKLRLETDIAINIQTTDAFSGSLQEHLFAENLLLVGDWLPYQVLDSNDVFLKRTQIKTLGNDISDCIINFQSLKRHTLGNREKMKQISSWQIAGKRISEIYKELHQ
jgi:hypothetical protein